MSRTVVTSFIAMLFCAAFTTSVSAAPIDDRTAIEKAAGMEAPPETGESPQKKDYVVVTGLDFAMWWMSDLTLLGPGLALGFVVVPDRFEMTVSFGALMGNHIYSVPLELNMALPHKVLPWLNLYVDFGPSLMLDKEGGVITTVFAVSAGGGLEILPPTFDWGIYLEGDFNMRIREAVDSQVGFSVGFRYRF